MADKAWKQRERQAAALFGARRAVLSGSSGRDDRSTSDSTHNRIYMEVKLRAKHAARTLYDEVKAAAKKEGKIPVVALADGSRPGLLICVHTDDLDAMIAERIEHLSNHDSLDSIERGNFSSVADAIRYMQK